MDTSAKISEKETTLNEMELSLNRQQECQTVVVCKN